MVDGVPSTASLFDGHRYAGPAPSWSRATAIAVHVGPTRPDGAGPGRAGDRVVDLAGGLLAPGFVDAHVHPIQGGLERIRCDLSEAARPARTTSPRSRAYAAAHPDAPWILGGGWAMAAFPGGTPDGRRPGRGGPGPAGVPAQPRPPRRLGQQPALELAGHRRATPRPADGRIERDADRPADRARCTRARCRWSSRHVPRTTATRTTTPRCWPGRRYLHSLGRHRLAGRHRRRLRRHGRPRRSTYRRPRPTATCTRDVVGALWWEPRLRRASRSRTWSARRAAMTARPVPGHHASRSCRTASPRTSRPR